MLSNSQQSDVLFYNNVNRQWLARLPHTSSVGGSIPASAVCVEFACSPRASGVSSGYSGFLSQSKDMHGRLIGISKLSIVYDCMSE
ncbi:hypothetical protein QTP70_028823 [Hemibagrus guttatus]|uniref:Uncharacterized protein n=1 Tax=Hemibagrus guttatus TaxID=175788 RepID=A0AAE0Q4F1_9TELE|nr:hypothetical protein QTP70_028823 [Hemibagrus guttatus]